MRRNTGTAHLTALLAALGTACLQGCTGQPPGRQGGIAQTAAASDERTCLIRAMYFESNRSSRDGLMAVGTVVMNRVASPLYPNTICGVVGQPGQFAAGVLTRPLNERELPGRTRRRRHFRGRTLQADWQRHALPCRRARHPISSALRRSGGRQCLLPIDRCSPRQSPGRTRSISDGCQPGGERDQT
jgi:hypothetical protein